MRLIGGLPPYPMLIVYSRGGGGRRAERVSRSALHSSSSFGRCCSTTILHRSSLLGRRSLVALDGVALAVIGVRAGGRRVRAPRASAAPSLRRLGVTRQKMSSRAPRITRGIIPLAAGRSPCSRTLTPQASRTK